MAVFFLYAFILVFTDCCGSVHVRWPVWFFYIYIYIYICLWIRPIGACCVLFLNTGSMHVHCPVSLFFFFELFFMRECWDWVLFLYTLLLEKWCALTCLFVFFFVFLIELFFTLWLNILWFVWVLYYSVWICEYLFKNLNVGICGVVVFVLTK